MCTPHKNPADRAASDALRYQMHREEKLAQARARYEKNRDEILRKRHAEDARDPEATKRKYQKRHLSRVEAALGMTYETALQMQGGVCRICRSPESGTSVTQRFVIDHDHRTGKFRGLLCHPCNVLIGYARDDPERLEAAASYLRASQAA